jgi:hypothetical protein
MINVRGCVGTLAPLRSMFVGGKGGGGQYQ